MPRFSIISGITQVWYHDLPGEEELMKTAPERAAILRILAQIPAKRFPELVEDVLREAEGHTGVDVTDGPGDEKQDILTLNQDQERHLTQCKHTVNFTERSSGDGLDVLFGACHRKDCEKGLYVTNGELTPQAKRYITDGEYRRLDEKNAPDLDYWDAKRLWERIARSPGVLKKWFGGMVQADGLRFLRFDVVVQRCPAWEIQRAPDLQALLNAAHGGEVIEARGFRFSTASHFVVDVNIDAPYRSGLPSVNVPLSALRVHAECIDSIVDLKAAVEGFAELLGSALPDPDESSWWHFYCTGAETLTHFMDLHRPVSVRLAGGTAFVKVGAGLVVSEDDYVSPRSAPPDGEGRDLEWRDASTDTSIRMGVDERMHPTERFTLWQLQLRQLEELKSETVFSIATDDAEQMHMVRRLLGPEAIALASNDGHVYWAKAEPEAQEAVESVAARRGLRLETLDTEATARLVDSVTETAEVPTHQFSSQRPLVTPVELDKRFIWISRDIDTDERRHPLSLLKFKLEYESRYGGFDVKEGTYAGEDLQRMLFDVFTIRGSKMVDIGQMETGLSIHLRYRCRTLRPTEDEVLELTKELDRIIEQISSLPPTDVRDKPGSDSPDAEQGRA